MRTDNLFLFVILIIREIYSNYIGIVLTYWSNRIRFHKHFCRQKKAKISRENEMGNMHIEYIYIGVFFQSSKVLHKNDDMLT
jgi:hypothetical protein